MRCKYSKNIFLHSYKHIFKVNTFVTPFRLCILGHLSHFVNLLISVFVWEKCDGYALRTNRHTDGNTDSHTIIKQ